MTAERWAHIKEIFSVAVEMPETDRHAYLESACGGNAELRGEVERLLTEHVTHTLHSPAASEMLAQYRVEAKLGEGRMGAVYRAYDTRLERQVAGSQAEAHAGATRIHSLVQIKVKVRPKFSWGRLDFGGSPCPPRLI